MYIETSHLGTVTLRIPIIRAEQQRLSRPVEEDNMKASDYIKLALAIRDNRESTRTMIYLASFLVDLCDILKADNPKFSKERFMENCK